MPSPSRPLDFLAESAGRRVLVQLRGQRAYRGELSGHDAHLNLVLSQAEELIGEEVVRTHGRVVVRGDSVVFISP